MPKHLEFHHEGTKREAVYGAYRNETDVRMKERYHAIVRVYRPPWTVNTYELNMESAHGVDAR